MKNLLLLGAFLINTSVAVEVTSEVAVQSETKADKNAEELAQQKAHPDFTLGGRVTLGITDHGDKNYRADVVLLIPSSWQEALNEPTQMQRPNCLKSDRQMLTLGYLQSENSWAVNVGSLDYFDFTEHFGVLVQGYLGYADANGSALLVSHEMGLFWRDTWWAQVNVQMDIGVEVLGLWGGNGDARRELQGVSAVAGLALTF